MVRVHRTRFGANQLRLLACFLLPLALLLLAPQVAGLGGISGRAFSDVTTADGHNVYLPVVSRQTVANVNRTTTGLMGQDEIWRGDLLITGDVEIPPGVTLTVEPGATVRFTAQSDDQHDPDEYDPQDPSTLHATVISILVRGRLDAQGTPEQPITFTSDRDVPGEMDWQSIMVEEAGKVTLDHVVVEHGYFGLQLNSIEGQASVTHSTIQYATTCGICTDRHPITGPIVVADSRFIGCGREAIDTCANQNIVVLHNLFTENYVAIMSVGSSITVMGNLFTANSRGIGVIENGMPTIVENEFTHNLGPAIQVTDASPIITTNNLYGNAFNVEIAGSARGVTAENNWWGSTDAATIDESIWDGKDDPALGLVDYEPYALQPIDLDVPQYPQDGRH